MLHPFRVLLSCDELKHVLISRQSYIYSRADVNVSPWDETGMCSYFEGNYKQLISKKFLLVDFPACRESDSRQPAGALVPHHKHLRLTRCHQRHSPCEAKHCV